MAVIGNSYINLIDVMSRSENGKIASVIVEILKQQNGILEDAIAIECNSGTKHLIIIRTGLPTVAWGALYQGIPQSKSTTQPVEDTTGFLEARSTVDVRLLALYGENKNTIRMSEAGSFLEAMNQEMATGMFYHDTAASPEKFKGLAARYSTLAAGGGSSNQLVDAGGVGTDNTSLWFVTWGEQYTSLLYPKGTQAGIKRDEKGEQRVLDAVGNPFFAMEEVFTWHIGVSVKDWRFNARICNIDVSDMKAGTVNLYTFMRQAYYKLQNTRIDRNGGSDGAGAKRLAIYCNRDVLECLDRLATNSGSTNNFTQLKYGEIEGKSVLTYRGIPIRETDALLNTEARVV